MRYILLALAIALMSQTAQAQGFFDCPTGKCPLLSRATAQPTRHFAQKQATALTATPAPAQVAPVTHKSEANHSRPFVGKSHKAKWFRPLKARRCRRGGCG